MSGFELCEQFSVQRSLIPVNKHRLKIIFFNRLWNFGDVSISVPKQTLKRMKKILTLIVLVVAGSLGYVFAQDRTITGKVSSAEDGSALPGVNVILKGTSRGTVTDSYGN